MLNVGLISLVNRVDERVAPNLSPRHFLFVVQYLLFLSTCCTCQDILYATNHNHESYRFY